MNQGDLVRLKQPFQPELAQPTAYHFGVIAAFAEAKCNGRANLSAAAYLLLHLCNAEGTATYTDDLGTKALFAFQPHEVEPC